MIEVVIERKDFLTKVAEAIGTSPLTIKLKKIDERAVIPTYAHNGDVGMDLTAIDVEYDEKLDMYIYHTGLSFESDFHYGQFLFPRSSNRETDAYLCNSVGIGDSAIYRGEILFCYKNRDSIETIAKIKSMETMFETLGGCGEGRLYYFVSLAQEEGKKTYDQVKEDARNLKYAPYKVGEKIGQMVFMAYPNVKIEIVDELSDTERGANGFGSTGK